MRIIIKSHKQIIKVLFTLPYVLDPINQYMYSYNKMCLGNADPANNGQYQRLSSHKDTYLDTSRKIMSK